MRRVSVASLLIALFALAGASVTPTRGFAGQQTSSIVWQTRGDRTAQVTRATHSIYNARPASQTAAIAALDAHGQNPPVLHALFQRPPPYKS